MRHLTYLEDLILTEMPEFFTKMPNLNRKILLKSKLLKKKSSFLKKYLQIYNLNSSISDKKCIEALTVLQVESNEDYWVHWISIDILN